MAIKIKNLGKVNLIILLSVVGGLIVLVFAGILIYRNYFAWPNVATDGPIPVFAPGEAPPLPPPPLEL